MVIGSDAGGIFNASETKNMPEKAALLWRSVSEEEGKLRQKIREHRHIRGYERVRVFDPPLMLCVV